MEKNIWVRLKKEYFLYQNKILNYFRTNKKNVWKELKYFWTNIMRVFVREPSHGPVLEPLQTSLSSFPENGMSEEGMCTKFPQWRECAMSKRILFVVIPAIPFSNFRVLTKVGFGHEPALSPNEKSTGFPKTSENDEERFANPIILQKSDPYTCVGPS